MPTCQTPPPCPVCRKAPVRPRDRVCTNLCAVALALGISRLSADLLAANSGYAWLDSQRRHATADETAKLWRNRPFDEVRVV